jgi:hypothetical protein
MHWSSVYVQNDVPIPTASLQKRTWEKTHKKYTHYEQLPNFQSYGVLMYTYLKELRVNATTPNLALHAHNSTATTVVSIETKGVQCYKDLTTHILGHIFNFQYQES